MGTATPVLPPPAVPAASRVSRVVRQPTFAFGGLVLTNPTSLTKGLSTTLTASVFLHGVLALALIAVPVFLADTLPIPDTAIRAFFAAPHEVAAPPPPPPPPPAGARAVTTRVVPARPVEPAAFVAPIEVPAEVKPEETMGADLGVEGGVPGGVEGGVPGGVVGGIIGGLPQALPSPPPVVRIGGQIVAPQVLHRVAPEYPRLAIAARLNAVIVVEALVDTHGVVQRVGILSGNPLFNEEAMAAVRQWRYKPLLLNGTPTSFILAVTISFHLQQPVEIKE